MFSRYYIDPDLARKNVPPKWNIKIHENGKALLLVMVQDCRKVVLERFLNIGPVRMSHIWIELEGPSESIDTLPGTTRTLPTWYWYIQPHQMDSYLAFLMFRIAGVDAQYVRYISPGTAPNGFWAGKVKEDDSPYIGYEWTVMSEPYPEPDIITGSHRFFRKYGLRESEAHAECFTHFLGESTVKLSASSDSTIGKLGLGSSFEGFSNPVWVKHCHVRYRVWFF